MLAGMMHTNRTEKYEQMREMLNEKQWRQYLALEAQERGSVRQVAQQARVSYNTILRGLRELDCENWKGENDTALEIDSAKREEDANQQ